MDVALPQDQLWVAGDLHQIGQEVAQLEERVRELEEKCRRQELVIECNSALMSDVF